MTNIADSYQVWLSLQRSISVLSTYTLTPFISYAKSVDELQFYYVSITYMNLQPVIVLTSPIDSSI